MSSFRINGATGDWEVVIGLEVHAQVTTNAKLFSGASTKFGAEPNQNVSLVDAAMPGMLPVPNRECIRQAVRTGMARSMNSNEAGQGSSPLIHGSADCVHPVRQGLWGATEVFIDTIIICTVTALSVLCSGQCDSGLMGARWPSAPSRRTTASSA